jgi:hypothetical protein
MGAGSRRKREARIARLVADVERFYPERQGQFLCPTCLRWFVPGEFRALSDAHILPASAGGKQSTILCWQHCNGRFGRTRDKWLSEYLRLIAVKDPAERYERVQRGHFRVGTLTVNGRFRLEGDEIRFDVSHRNSQRVINALPEQIAETVTRAVFPPGQLYERRRTMKIVIPGPLLWEHRDQVALGCLTAAYLMWFKSFGYSWALQKHLDIVRAQIQTEALTVLPRSFCGAISEEQNIESSPWIGLGTVNGELALLAAVADRIVLFPPADSPNLYDRLPQDTLEGAHLEVTILKSMRLPKDNRPHGVVYKDRLVIAPDVLLKGDYPVWLFRDDGKIETLDRMSEEEWAKRTREPNEIGIKVSSPISVPSSDTGR